MDVLRNVSGSIEENMAIIMADYVDVHPGD
jgi:hypothetical protein